MAGPRVARDARIAGIIRYYLASVNFNLEDINPREDGGDKVENKAGRMAVQATETATGGRSE